MTGRTNKRVLAALSGTALAAATLGVALPAEAAHKGGTKTYTAALTELNDSGATGSSTFTLRGNTFTAAVDVAGLDDTLHPQHIHEGSVCPPAEADVNGDGFIDVIEGIPFYGPVFINLDNDFADPSATLDFPTGSSYSYEGTGTRSSYQAATGDALKLGRRHVVVHGVDPSTPLPDSVASLPGLPAWATLPVACGELSMNR
jgi:hypothetical protein